MILHEAGMFRNNDCVVRIPLVDQFTFRDFRSILHHQHRTVGHVVLCQHAVITIENGHNAAAAEHECALAFVCFDFDGFDAFVVKLPIELRGDLRLRCDHARRAARVERAERELCSWLADRLGGNNPDRLAHLHKFAGAEVTTIAFCANAALCFARQDRTNLHRLDGGFADAIGFFLVNHFACFDNRLVRQRVNNVMHRDSPENALGKRFLYVLALFECARHDAANRTAVLHFDNGVLGNVNETSSQVAGVGSFQRRVCKTFTRAVGRDEVFENRKPLAEIRDNGILDQFARRAAERFLRLRHQPAHAGKLAHLLLRAASAGINHHIERVEPVA